MEDLPQSWHHATCSSVRPREDVEQVHKQFLKVYVHHKCVEVDAVIQLNGSLSRQKGQSVLGMLTHCVQIAVIDSDLHSVRLCAC